MKALLSALLILCLSSQALAETPPITTFPPGDDKIVSLRKGQEAPFDGQLFDTSTALRWGNWLQQYKYRLKSDVETQQDICTVQTSYADELLRIEKQQYLVVTDMQQKKIIELEKKLAQPSPWYENGVLHFTLGAVSMAGIVALSAWAISSTN